MDRELEKLDLFELFRRAFVALRKFWLPVCLITLILSTVFYMHARRSYVPYYQSQVTFTVNTQDSSLLLYGNSGSKQIQESLPYILESKYMKNLVMEDLNLNTFPATLELESKELAGFYILRVKARDPQTAYEVANSVMDLCPQASVYVLGKVTFEILDDAVVAAAPYNSAETRTGAIKGCLLGMILSCGLVAVYVLTNCTIQTEEDLKKYLNTKYLAAVPKVKFKKHRRNINQKVLIHNASISDAFLENIYALRTRVQQGAAQIGAKVILVTSSVPEEGKSTVAANLALSLAENGSRVILVDLDLRKPSVNQAIGTGQGIKTGVADILDGKSTWQELAIEAKKWNLTVLYGGRKTDNPLKLIQSSSMKQMIREMKENYDYVILDTPPAAMLSDASAVAEYADCGIYVVKQDFASVALIKEGLSVLNDTGLPVLGVVINGLERLPGHYGKDRYYGGYYGAGYRTGKKAPQSELWKKL